MSAGRGRRAEAHKPDKPPMSHLKLLSPSALCGTLIVTGCSSDGGLCVFLHAAGTWDLHFLIRELQNRLFI